MEKKDLSTTTNQFCIDCHCNTYGEDVLLKNRKQLRQSLEQKSALQYVGVRRNAMRAVKNAWNTGNFSEGHVLPYISRLADNPIIEFEICHLLSVGEKIAAFVQENPSPEAAYKKLQGSEPSNPLTWHIRPYGICFIGEREDLVKLLEEKYCIHSAKAGCSTNRSDLDPFVAIVFKKHVFQQKWDSPILEEALMASKEHELLHTYFAATDFNGRRALAQKRLHVDHLYAQSLSLDPSSIEKTIRKYTHEHASFFLKEEIICYMLTEPEYLVEHSIFGEGVYSFRDPYNILTSLINESGSSKADELYRKQRREIGWPEQEACDDSESTEEMRKTRILIEKIREAVIAPYKQAYDNIVELTSEALLRGISCWDIIDVIKREQFLEIPVKLEILLSKTHSLTSS